ncbi:hypothetical protein BX666DRAFT_1974353 [Dichotomocladium elegans]|nr:hypothetical protein BX666DRAFT_1974353 [Dichotomocladium elegans]
MTPFYKVAPFFLSLPLMTTFFTSPWMVKSYAKMSWASDGERQKRSRFLFIGKQVINVNGKALKDQAGGEVCICGTIVTDGWMFGITFLRRASPVYA